MIDKLSLRRLSIIVTLWTCLWVGLSSPICLDNVDSDPYLNRYLVVETVDCMALVLFRSSSNLQVAFMHSKNIMHRDIKGANLLISNNG